MKVNEDRVRKCNRLEYAGGPVLYWMSREQRVHDNWALLFAQESALDRGESLSVVFCLVPEFLGATMRQYSFMIEGLQEAARELERYRIPFHLLTGSPVDEILRFTGDREIGCVVTDCDPLRIRRQWREAVAQKLTIPLFEVDAHNVVPCWIASPKQEYSAYTLRSKITPMIPEYLTEFPRLMKHPNTFRGSGENSLEIPAGSIRADARVGTVSWLRPGEKAARSALSSFVKEKLPDYDAARNRPEEDGQSNLSPYLHFGHLSAQRVVYEVQQAEVPPDSRDAFLEELIVRRELSDNLCSYNEQYDTVDCFPRWARESLNAHRNDEREYRYSLEEFEDARTHDDLWNAAQREMVVRGKMHGYMRMYWAKKILEWSASPEEALHIAIYLNDRYELDGRDPNGYAGIAWSIGGLHDRAWKERPVFGKVRYMSARGCAAKFDVKRYITQWSG